MVVFRRRKHIKKVTQKSKLETICSNLLFRVLCFPIVLVLGYDKWFQVRFVNIS